MAGGEELRGVVEQVGHGDARRQGGRGPRHLDEGRVVDQVQGAHRVEDARRGGAVGLEDGVGAAPRLGAVGTAKGDVHARVGEGPREGSERAGRVLVRDEQGGVQARDLDVHAVDGADAHAAASEALAAHVRLSPRVAHQVDIDRVGVDRGVVSGDVEPIGEPRGVREREGVGDALVVGVEPERSGHERPVRSVSAVGVGKAVPEREAHRLDGALDKGHRHARAAERPRRMRRRGPDHDGPQYLKRRGRCERLGLRTHGSSYWTGLRGVHPPRSASLRSEIARGMHPAQALPERNRMASSYT